MEYISTRGRAAALDFEGATLAGLASNGRTIFGKMLNVMYGGGIGRSLSPRSASRPSKPNGCAS